jgi:ribosomal protein S2
MNLFTSNTVLAALAAAVLSLATPAGAQTRNLRVAVPFNFVVGDQLLRAGEYRIDVDDARHMLSIASADTRSVSYVRVLPVTTRRSTDAADRAVVRFAKQGEHYALEGVWQRGELEGNTVARSHRTIEAAKAGPVRDITAGSN